MKDELEREANPLPPNVVTNNERVEQQIVAQGGPVSITTTSVPQIVAQNSPVTVTVTTLDWKLLEALTEQWKSDTRDVIGQGLRVARTGLRQDLQNALLAQRFTAVLGDSGVGKSVLVKNVVQEALPGPCYCLHADEIPRLPSTQLATAGMVRSLDDLVPSQTAPWALLVLDGMERLTGTNDLRTVARAIRSMNLLDEASPWRLVVTCQSAAWDTLRRELQSHNLPMAGLPCINVALLTGEEIRAATSELNVIKPLVSRPDLHPVIGRAKVLDLVTRAAAEIGLPDTTHWVGESSLVDWFWKDYVLGAAGRTHLHGNLLQYLARTQADQRQFVTPISDVASEQVAAIDDLARLGLVRVRHETLRFTHDVYADYARQRYLLGQLGARRVDVVTDRQVNSHWHRAIRLLGQHFLESAGGGIDAWRGLIRDLRGAPSRVGYDGAAMDSEGAEDGTLLAGTAVDLLLEAIVFCPQAERLLDTIFPDLCTENGLLLRSFLFRLAHTGVETVDVGNVPWKSPRYSLWTPCVRWMMRHLDTTLKLAPNEFVSIAETWLLSWHRWCLLMHPRIPGIELVHEIGEAVLDLLEYTPRAVKDNQLLYTLAFFRAPAHRERAMPLFLRLSGREAQVEDPAPPKEPGVERDVPEQLKYLLQPISFSPGPPPEPWPDGPRTRTDKLFKETALTEFGAERIVKLGADFAREVFLALLIELPARRDWNNYDISRDSLGLSSGPWTSEPPFYDFAPAVALLREDAAVGLDFVVRLVNFVTDRWAEAWPVRQSRQVLGQDSRDVPGLSFEEDVPCVGLTLFGETRTYLGDRRVFEWSAGNPTAPRWASAALMALEHWLYAQEELGTLDDDTLANLLSTNRSAAVLGVLLDLALKKQTLLSGPLEPLLGSAEILYWGTVRAFGLGERTRSDSMFSWWGKPTDQQERAKLWHEMPHRSENLFLIVSRLFVVKKLSWPLVEESRLRWMAARSDLSASPFTEWLDGAIAALDTDNWHIDIDADGHVTFRFSPPEAVIQREKAATADVQNIQARWSKIGFVMRCREALEKEHSAVQAKPADFLVAASQATLSDEEQSWMLGGPWAIRCAAAALAIVRFPDWLDDHPEWKERCKEWLLLACFEQPLAGTFTMRIGAGGSWAYFCVRVLPQMWLETPQDDRLRRAIAILVGATYDDTQIHAIGAGEDLRSRLLRTLAAARHQHRDDFLRLLHLAIWFARLRHISRAGPLQSAPKIDLTFTRFVEDFVRCRLAPLPEEWPSIATVWPKGLKRPKGWPKWVVAEGRHNGFDIGALLSALTWLRDEAGNATVHDRPFLVRTVTHLAGLIFVTMDVDDDDLSGSLPVQSMVKTGAEEPSSSGLLGCLKAWWSRLRRALRAPKNGQAKMMRTGGHRQRDGGPGMAGWIIADWCAAYVVREPDGLHRKRIWEPWFQPPRSSTHWPETLVGKLYSEGFSETPATSCFVEAIREVFAFSFSPRGWLDREGSKYGSSELARAFLGAPHSYLEDQWNSERVPVALALRQSWERWVAVAMGWHRCASRFLHLLETPAMKELRVQALGWIAQTDVEEWLNDENAQRALADLLVLIWSESGEVAKLGAETRVVFDGLLDQLVKRRNAEAVLLARQVAGGTP